MQYITICIDLVHNFLVFTLGKKTEEKVYKSLHPLYKKLQTKPAILACTTINSEYHMNYTYRFPENKT